MAGTPRLFDAHLHPRGLSDQDLDTLRYFGVERALVAADHAAKGAKPTDLYDHFADLVEVQLPRLERFGIRAYAAVGVHPRAIPRKGLTEVLSALPGYFRGGKVVALGEIGLHAGGETEEEAFTEQLALARRLRLPVLVHTPVEDKERLTRRALVLLRASDITPHRVLVNHANGRTARLILECGHFAGLTIRPDELSTEQAVGLVRKLGAERLVLDSGSGEGASDLLGLPRVASRLLRVRLSSAVVARVTFENARECFRASS
ncbi:MAG: TatD family hydrolase [Myxococcota bacterium]